MKKKGSVLESLTGLVALLCVVAFLLIGFLTDKWNPTWVIFLLIPLTSIIVGIARNRKDVQGVVTSIVALLCVAGYLLLGFMADAWHPGWLIFFAVPISGIVVKMFTSDREEGAHNADPPHAADQ